MGGTRRRDTKTSELKSRLQESRLQAFSEATRPFHGRFRSETLNGYALYTYKFIMATVCMSRTVPKNGHRPMETGLRSCVTVVL